MGALDRYLYWPPGLRHTDPTARVCRFRPMAGVRAVRITNAHYRKAPVSGVFELYEPGREDPVLVQPSGKKIVKVICAWQGYKPSQSCARIDVTSSTSAVEVLDDFTGDVVDNIGHPTDPLPLDADVPPPPTADVEAPRETAAPSLRSLKARPSL